MSFSVIVYKCFYKFSIIILYLFLLMKDFGVFMIVKIFRDLNKM